MMVQAQPIHAAKKDKSLLFLACPAGCGMSGLQTWYLMALSLRGPMFQPRMREVKHACELWICHKLQQRLQFSRPLTCCNWMGCWIKRFIYIQSKPLYIVHMIYIYIYYMASRSMRLKGQVELWLHFLLYLNAEDICDFIPANLSISDVAGISELQHLDMKGEPWK